LTLFGDPAYPGAGERTRKAMIRRPVRSAVALVATAVLTLNLSRSSAAAQVKTIYIVPGAHFDVGFDAPPAVVREHRIKAVEDALAAAETDPDFHWMEDGAWGFGGWLERYRGDAARLARASRALRNGQLIVSAVWTSPHGSIFPEFLGFLTAHLEEMGRLLGVRPEVAILDDAPSHPEALVDALAGSGIRYMLVGANMFVTTPLPVRLVRSPFWWESAKGARVLVYIDPNSYGQANDWPWVQDTSRFTDPALSADDRLLLASADQGFRKLLSETTSKYDAIVFEHAFDDWPVSAVMDIAPFVRLWTAQRLEPGLVTSSPLDYFRHIEARYGKDFPVYRGEWGGQWDEIRAMCPVWTWRLREAMKRIRPDAPVDVREAAATAMDHGLTLGPGWPGKFTEEETIEHARGQAQVFARAVEMAGRVAGEGATDVLRVNARPEFSRRMEARPPDPGWEEVLADPPGIRVRVGPGQLAPFLFDNAPPLDVPMTIEAHGPRLTVRLRIDRAGLPGADSRITYVVLELPLRAAKDRLRIAPEGSPSALAGRWLRGAPPDVVVAPEGLRVMGSARPLRVSSPLAFSYTLVQDPADAKLTWLQVLLVRQCDLCELKDGTKKVLPFQDLYPGEPSVLDTWVEASISQNGEPLRYGNSGVAVRR
jgi:hypothetical protein